MNARVSNPSSSSLPGIGPDARHQWADSKWTSKHPDWSEDVPMHRVEGKAGDCILFTEKMTHGTVPWEGAGERRTLFYKYVPCEPVTPPLPLSPLSWWLTAS